MKSNNILTLLCLASAVACYVGAKYTQGDIMTALFMQTVVFAICAGAGLINWIAEYLKAKIWTRKH